MKKALSLLLAGALSAALLAGCSSSGAGSSSASPSEAAPAPSSSASPEAAPSTASKGTITVGASATPHAEILEAARPLLEKEGYELKVIEFADYVQPNLALQSGDLDANFFQHLPYLEDFNVKNKTNLVSLVAVHYEPFGVFPGKTKTLADLKDGAKIAVPNDSTNEARALLLLEAQGLIKVKVGAGLQATKKDIVENARKFDIIEIEAAQLPRSLPDVDMAVINGNFALQAGLNASTDAVAVETKDSPAATFQNIVAIRKGDENREELKALMKAITSEEVRSFIDQKYSGAVVPSF